ncbi:MAG: sn-glycerol-3-phosphate ABC transporter ATP-binding protein UgpC [Chlamydiae bacterium]|nr:sn-glycerol-3-phosphate ABC transporter ATP-binding protein UgpC [Chlamydiota bacterium]MBI3266533.1 sn-glycerol-3-phosphate ABC transporter ATP-binding protein UgpC [Chlamydiota bacterium]
MAQVQLKNLNKLYSGNIVAVKNLNLEIKDKEFVVLVGPSGCGKSSTLRMVAGLEEITLGEITIDGQRINEIPAKDRDIAMVFQNYALYPHMTVYKNMAFGLMLRKFPKSEIERRVREASEILGIQNLLDRKPAALSGGQRQRVAVGRAIVRKPKAFLFDEPLSNLDAKLRVQMRTEISKLHIRLQSTMIYVTHDQVEAMTMGDRIVVMKDGEIQQVGDPLTIYNKPANKFVAGFIGSPPMNFIEGVVAKREGYLFFKEDQFQVKITEGMSSHLSAYLDKKVTLGIRPEDIYDKLFLGDASPDNTTKATVEVVEPMGAELFLYLKKGKLSFVARVDTNQKAEVNQDLEMVLDMSKAHFFDPVTEKTIA